MKQNQGQSRSAQVGSTPDGSTHRHRTLSDPAVVDRLGEDLRAAGYDASRVPELLGAAAHRALGRGELAPALRATRDRSPLATLTRLFLLGAVEDEPLVRAALPSTGVDDAVAQGVLEHAGDGIRAALDIRPLPRTPTNSCSSPIWTPTPGPGRCAAITYWVWGRRR